MSEDEFYIVDVRPEWRHQPYVTVWRPNNAGYAWPLPWAGRYHRDALRLGYHASKGDGQRYIRFPVPCAAAERLAIPTPAPKTVDGDVGPVLPNDATTRRALRAARVIPKCDLPGGRPMGDQSAQFDIRDGRNHYQCCPRCAAILGMGMTTKRGMVLVVCTTCWFEGPGVPFDPTRPIAADLPAFNAWNALRREGSDD